MVLISAFFTDVMVRDIIYCWFVEDDSFFKSTACVLEGFLKIYSFTYCNVVILFICRDQWDILQFLQAHEACVVQVFEFSFSEPHVDSETKSSWMLVHVIIVNASSRRTLAIVFTRSSKCIWHWTRKCSRRACIFFAEIHFIGTPLAILPENLQKGAKQPAHQSTLSQALPTSSPA